MFDVIGLGCSCIDFLGIIPYMPGLDEEIEMLQTSQQGGGEVATALVALAKLGSSVAYVGKIGDDLFGDFIKADFDRYGVDTSHLIVEKGATSQASIVLVDKKTGKRTILGCQYTASEMEPTEIRSDFIEQTKYLLLDGSFRRAALEAARRARKTGVTIVLDADVLAYDPEIHQLIELTDILIPSRTFSRFFTKTEEVDKATEVMRSYGPSIVLITLGDQGSICYAEGKTFHTPAFELEVVDTTGAGDVFHGAFIHGLLQGWRLEKVVEFATAVAAIKCTKLGGRAGIPSFEEAMEFLKSRGARYS
jgi:sulfofructose kinase